MNVNHDMVLLLTRDLDAFAREIELFPDDELLWKPLPGIVNSAGNLAMHVCGNLNHFIGARLGGTGYVRNREAEFNTRSGARAELIDTLRKTAEVVRSVLPAVTEERLRSDYPEAVGGTTLPCGRFLLHLCTHVTLHLGQAGYLRRALTGREESIGPASVKALAEG